MGRRQKSAGKQRTLVDRYRRRLDDLRGELLAMLESEPPGSRRVLMERPAIEAEIWAIEAELAAAANEWAKAMQASRAAGRAQAEARKAVLIVAAQRVEEIERKLGLNNELGEELEHLR